MKKSLLKLFLVAALCLPWVTMAQTDTLTVANGTETNSYVPFFGLWMDAPQHNQVLYPASMTATIVGDSITGMGFYMSGTNSSPWGCTVTIRLGISANATLSGLDNTTALTQVWQGTVNGQGDIWINFDNAYPFQGGNLLVDIQTSGASWGSASFYGISQNGGSYYSYNGSGDVQGFIPKTSFLHVEGDFTVCLMPTNLVADIDSNQIAISWNPAAGVSGYNIYLNDTLVDASYPDTFYVFSNLTSNTVYNIAVTSDCGDSESPAIGGDFRTDCAEMVIPFFTNFDSDPYGVFPPCWTRVIQAGTDPSVNDVWSHSGSQSMYLQASYAYNMFASQAIPLAGNNIKVNFWAYLNANYDGWIKAGVMTDRNDTSTFIPLITITDMNSTWTNYEFSTHDLDANATYYAAFLYYGTYAYNYGSSAIDDISITTTDGCAMPRLAAIDSVDSAFVSLYWIPGSSNNNYEVAYGTSNDVNAANVISEITGTTYTVNDLNPGTMYYFWVRNICTNDDTTAWMFAGNVRTACSDGSNAPYEEHFVGYDYEIPACWTVLESTDNYGSIAPYVSGNYLYFYPKFNQPNLIILPYIRLATNAMNIEVTGYVYSYNPTTFEVGYVTNPDSASTFVALGTITATSSTDYEFNTSAVTADSIWIAFRATTTSQYSYAYLNSVRISALGSCMRPDYLAIDTVGHDMAMLHCNNTGAGDYEVLYATVNNINAASAQSETASDTVITLTNLTPSTHYYTWVRAYCSASESSEWRPGPDFTTMCGEDYCVMEIVMEDSYGDGWNGNAINIYTNGVFQTTATIDDGSSNTVIQSICEGDSLALIWVSGSYPGETSFEIFHAGIQVASGSGSYFYSGDTVVSVNGCPNCMPVSNVIAIDSLATDESITVTWTPNSSDDNAWAITLDGQFVGISTDTFYTFNNLVSRTDYIVGVATLCDQGDTSDYVYVTTATVCAGNNCSMVINMHDSYGDGWNGHAINVFLNGTQVMTATLSSGSNGTVHLAMCEGDTVILTGTSGLYASEVSFEVYHSGALVLQGTGSDLASGNPLVLLEGCPSCVSPSEIYVNNITTSSASISWNTNGVASSWHLTVNSASAMLVDTYVTSVPYTVTGLQAASGYTVTVSSICDDDTANATYATFITACDDITLPWLFTAASDPSALTSSMPLCWYSPQTYESYGSVYPYNSSYYGLYIYGYGSSPCMAATPRIPTAGNNIYVRFHAETYTYGMPTLTAGIMTDPANPTTYIPLVNITNEYLTEYEFTTDNVPGIAATDTVYVAFQSTPPSGYGYGYIYLQDVYVQAIPNCHRPDSIVVTNVTDNSATLTWPNTGANNYTVSYGDTSFVVTTTSVNLTGLESGSAYTIYLQGNCTADSSLLQHVTFNTVCSHNTIPWTESFETFQNYTAPLCWTFYEQYPDYDANITPYVYDYSYYAHTGTKCLYLIGESTNNTMAVSPMLTGYPMNTLQVSFWVYGTSYAGFEAGFMTDANDTSTFIPVLTVPSTSYNLVQYSFQTNTMTNTDSSYYFAIRYISTDSYSNSLAFDDISIVNMPDCSNEFDAIAVSDISDDSVTISWTPGIGINANSTYTVTVMNANNSVVSTINNATSPLILSGLNGDSEYNVYVSLNCGGSVSAVSDTINFMTLCSGLETYYSYDDSTMTAGTSEYAPIGYSYYNYSYTQTIIDSARFGELAGDIVAFAFLPTTADAGDYFTHMDVYMANVPENDLSTDWITPDSNHVFVQVINDADMCYTSATWQQHVFDNRFTWDGHSNVLISIRRNHGVWSSGSEFAIHYGANTANKTRYSYNDNNSYDINNPSAATSYSNYLDDFVGDLMFFACGNACPAPVATATVNDYQGATITWTCSADTIEYALKDASEPSYQLPARVYNTGLVYAGNLDPATTYMFHIRAVCGDGVTSEWTEISFTTDSLPCFAPTDVTATPAYDAVTVNWTPGTNETMWNVHIWNSAKDTNVTVNTNPATIGGLAQTTTYNVAVQALCGNGVVESDFSDTVSFTTLTCAPVSDVTVSNVTGSSATVTWSGTVQSYDIEYGDHGFGQGQGTKVNGITAQTYTIQGLDPEAQYDVYVRANCDANNASDWSPVVSFTTTAGEGINTADGMNVTIFPNPTSTSTTISLSGVSGDVQISIVDMNGRTVMNETMSCDGSCTKQMEVSGLASGAYFVRVSGEGVNMVKKLVVK